MKANEIENRKKNEKNPKYQEQCSSNVWKKKVNIDARMGNTKSFLEFVDENKKSSSL